MDLLEAARAADVTRTLTENLTSTVPDGPLMLYRGLHTVSLEAAEQRGYCGGTTHVTMFCPLEVVARACRVHRVTVWRWAGVLKSLGLIDMRSHKGTLRGETRNTGTLWQVRLHPGRGRAARLSYEEMKHPWRDLDADVRRKRTAYRQLREDDATVREPANDVDLDLIRGWAVTPYPQQNPVMTDSCTRARVSLEAVLDVPHVDRSERNRMVDLAAEALAQALSDRGAVNFYRRLMWQLLRASDRQQGDYFYAVYLAAARAQVDVREGFARRGGALFTSRVKGAAWWDELWRGPPVRVGSPPLKA